MVGCDPEDCDWKFPKGDVSGGWVRVGEHDRAREKLGELVPCG